VYTHLSSGSLHISLSSINIRFLCEVEIEFLNIRWMNFILQRV
jgi:hypothetical protein